MSVILYRVPRNDDAIIGIASFVSVFKIGPLVKFPSTLLFPHLVFSSIFSIQILEEKQPKHKIYGIILVQIYFSSGMILSIHYSK